VRLWIAQGFGIGRVPFAPGTFGSFLGLLWFALLLLTGHLWSFVLGAFIGFLASVWLCGRAEITLKQKDPGSVVLDEITAIPACFISLIAFSFWKSNAFPALQDYFSGYRWIATLGVVGLFRLFDIWKPWPVRQSQSLPGGWGVTVDDFLAAFYVACILLVIVLWKGWPLWR
jgi:phosphatidylglycerophosphatase A